MKHWLLLLTLVLLGSCTPDKKEKKSASHPIEVDINQPLKKQALREDDYIGRARVNALRFETVLIDSAKDLDPKKSPKLSVDDNCGLVYSYTNGNDRYEKRVAIHDLQHANNGMKLQADDGVDVLFPGFSVSTIDSAPLVEVYKNGDFVQKDNILEFVLKDRKSVEEVLPVVVSLINVCKEMQSNK